MQIFCRDTATFDIVKKSFMLPTPHKPFTFCHAVQLQMLYVPQDWLEQSLNIPFPGYFFKVHLPLGLSIDGAVKSIIVSNEFLIGPRWNYRYKHFHIGTGMDFNINYGWLNGCGFNNSQLFAYQVSPKLSAGGHFHNMSVTFSSGINYMLDYQIVNDNISHNQTRNSYNGINFSFHIEQRLFKNKVVTFGVVANYTRFHILIWPVYNPVRTQAFIPQFNLGLNF
jgi:hypothetical protein